jgi:hypothetical protein
MRYRILATSLEDRRCLLTLADDGGYYLLVFAGRDPRQVKVEGWQAEQLQYSRGWVPTKDHRPHTMYDLRRQLSFV